MLYIAWRRGEYESGARGRGGGSISASGRSQRCRRGGAGPPTGHVPRTCRKWDRRPVCAGQKLAFVELNRDEPIKAATRASYTGLEHLWLPRTMLSSDFVVSMPKIKTHHRAGVTLSHGWPKNILHWKGIHRSILDICATAPIHFVIADGVTAMGRATAPCTERMGASARSCSPKIPLRRTSYVRN